MNIVLFEPEMPANTGNIGRTCVATGSALNLIDPLGFLLNEKMIKRAGLDYWDQLDVRRYINFNDFLEKNNYPEIFMATTKTERIYSDVSYKIDSYVMFGPESRGIPEEILVDYKDTCVRIPMLDDTRSLNLSNSVAVIVYEAMRQNGFSGLNTKGHLHRLSYDD